MCSKWYHMKCLKLSENDIWGAWHRPGCGRMPSEEKNMNIKIDTLRDLERCLVENENEDTQTNRESVGKLEEENAVLRHQNEFNELKRRLNDREKRKTEHNKSLIRGRSIIRNTDEKKTWQHWNTLLCKVQKWMTSTRSCKKRIPLAKDTPKSSYLEGEMMQLKNPRTLI